MSVGSSRRAARLRRAPASQASASESASSRSSTAAYAERYGAHEDEWVGEPSPVLERVRRLGSALIGGQQLSGALLLHDLKELYGRVQDAELEWVVLLQAAKAARDQELKTAAEEG